MRRSARDEGRRWLEQAEEDLIREAVAKLPRSHYTLVRLQAPDPNRGRDNGGCHTVTTQRRPK